MYEQIAYDQNHILPAAGAQDEKLRSSDLCMCIICITAGSWKEWELFERGELWEE